MFFTWGEIVLELIVAFIGWFVEFVRVLVWRFGEAKMYNVKVWPRDDRGIVPGGGSSTVPAAREGKSQTPCPASPASTEPFKSAPPQSGG